MTARRTRRKSKGGQPQPGSWNRILLIEDNAARSERRTVAGVRSKDSLPPVFVRLHEINGSMYVKELKKSQIGSPKRGLRKATRSDLALALLKKAKANGKPQVVVAGSTYACNSDFQTAISQRKLDFVGELRPSTRVKVCKTAGRLATKAVPILKLLKTAEWTELFLFSAVAKKDMPYCASVIGEVELSSGISGRLFAAQVGGIGGVHQDTIVGFSSNRQATLAELLQTIGWVRWIRPIMRQNERTKKDSAALAPDSVNGVHVNLRSNITLSRKQDDAALWAEMEQTSADRQVNGKLATKRNVLKIAELFAGAGGMGLGFLLAQHKTRRYRVVFSGEVDPIYAQTLRSNHETFIKGRRADREDYVPSSIDPLDLRTRRSFEVVASEVKSAGGVDVLIGGPPCQGFSNANRNSWHRDNPHNRLVNVFVRYVEKLMPRVFLMENVQGILWTAKNGKTDAQPSIIEHFARRLRAAGYLLFPRLLDAVWFGVPQFRTRFFLIGIHKDVGYSKTDFGAWGPFPHPTHGPGTEMPFTTVRQAIADLPKIGNGYEEERTPYVEQPDRSQATNPFLSLMRNRSPKGIVVDHVTSRHADYVIERYKQIPAGGNWEDIAHTLTNYSDVGRTHSNIYRRLAWEEPSITIGHYRKSMLVHPSQHRGLSLREASRLQSFPDWFRFAGSADGTNGGLVHKQQQLANAVCPLITKAIAEFILGL
jgi:DNA-cytosine methyltransferase